MIVPWVEEINWTEEQKQELFNSVFGWTPRLSKGDGSEHPLQGETTEEL